MNVVDSPPGTTSPSSPSSCSGLRTSTGSAPRRRSIAACSRKFPWRARTPIVIRRILDFGYRWPAATRQEDRDRDEDEPGDREDDRPRPLVPVMLLVALELDREREQEQPEERRGDVGPLVRPVGRDLEDPPGAEHDPARAPEPVPDRDVEERGDGDQNPVEVALV